MTSSPYLNAEYKHKQKHMANESQAARQGLAVLMASTSVVLKHETSTLRQRHNFILIDLKFGVSDYVREVIPALPNLIRVR